MNFSYKISIAREKPMIPFPRGNVETCFSASWQVEGQTGNIANINTALDIECLITQIV